MREHRKARAETRTLQGKVRHVLAKKPYLASDYVGVAQEVWLTFWGHLFDPPVQPEEAHKPGSDARLMVPLANIARLPTVKEVEAAAAKVSVPEQPYWSRY